MAELRSAAGDALTELVLKVFRLNGAFLDVADDVTRGTGLTAARWQVVGAVLRGPLPVAGVARAMGLTRQAVQRLADALVEDGLCEYADNPAHQRAKLLAPTERGWAAIRRIHPVQVDWANRVSASVGLEALGAANAAADALLAVLASPAGRPAGRPATQLAGRRAGRPTTQPAGRTAGRPTRQPAARPKRSASS